MPTWSGILKEIQQPHEQGINPFDAVRRKYLVEASHKTGRSTILYATAFTTASASNVPPESLSIRDGDLQGIMEVISKLPGPSLDLILHSPGGSIEAAEALARYLRSKFDHIRVVVPHLAMSAAAMIACVADEILMGKHSFLGPVDSQVQLHTPLGMRMVPADAILEQFDRAQKECQDPRLLPSWAPMLSQFGPDLIVKAENARKLSRLLVTEWLARHMFKGVSNATNKAEEIADWLADHGEHKTHGRHISRQQLMDKGLKIRPLEEDQKIQDLFLSVFHATTHLFASTPTVKIIENNLGRGYLETVRINNPPPAIFPARRSN